MKLIIQIPCFNEAETLHRVVSDLPSRIDGVDSIETLVVDDGSRDGTSAVALGLGADHVVRHNQNRGLAAAFATGLDASLRLGADVIVNTDGDHQYPGSAIERLVEPIVAGRADLVVGDRRPGEDEKFSLLKRWLQRCGRRVVSRLAGRDLADPVSGFRAYSRSAAERTHIVTGYSYTIESLLQASCKGLAIEFVPIETNAATRLSRLFRSLPQFISRSALTILRVFFMFHPLRVLAWISGLLAVAGALPIGRFLYLYIIGEGAGHDYAINGGGRMIRSGTGPDSLDNAAGHQWPDMSASTGVCYQRSRVKFRDIIDGLSQTYLVGEKQIPFTRYRNGSDMGDNESAYSGDDRDLIRYTGTESDPRFQPVSDAYVPGEEGAVFGSAHSGVFQMALCDGAIKAVSYSIDPLVHSHLGIRNDRQVIPGDALE